MYDALIVGGGPAGLAAGIVLGDEGCKVLLCEAKKLPADKPCGEGLMPSGVRYLEQLGIGRAMLGQGWRAFSGIRYVAPSGRVAQASFAEGPGLGIRRTALSAALLERTRHVPNLVVVDRTRVELGRQVLVDGLPIDVRLIIGADGLHSHVRRWAGLERAGRSFQRWGARRHFAVRPWSSFVEVLWSADGVEAYVTPSGVSRVGVAFLWDRERTGPLPGRRLFEVLLARFPALEAKLAGAEADSELGAIGPLLQPTRDVVQEPVLLLGDAAGYVDAITGEGLSLAFAEALALREAVAPALSRGAPLRPALRDYRRRHFEITRAYRLFTRLVLAAGRSPALVERLVALLADRPRLFQHLLSLNMGQFGRNRGRAQPVQGPSSVY